MKRFLINAWFLAGLYWLAVGGVPAWAVSGLFAAVILYCTASAGLVGCALVLPAWQIKDAAEKTFPTASSRKLYLFFATANTFCIAGFGPGFGALAFLAWCLAMAYWLAYDPKGAPYEL